MSLNIAVLVSAGRHPHSGRPRRAALDAQAVELALRLQQQLPDGGGATAIKLIHAGDPQHPSLRDYLGMGISDITVLEQPVEAGTNAVDIIPTLHDYLKHLRPALVLAGRRAESGEDSGMVPYLLAERLGLTLVADVVDLEFSGDTPNRLRLLTALARGQRRAITASLPLLVTVDPAAPPARQSAFGPAQRGSLHRLASTTVTDPVAATWQIRPARKRPKRLKVANPEASAAERLRAATQTQVGGQVLTGLSPEQAAQSIYDALCEQGVVKLKS